MLIISYGDLHAANIYNYNIKKSNFNISEYSRIDELCSTLSWIETVTQQHKPMFSVNLGDTFHQALKFFTERFNTVTRGIADIQQATISKTGYVIEGNHDRDDDISALDLFDKIQGTKLIRNKAKIEPMLSEINSCFIFVPFSRNIEVTKEVFKHLYERYKSSHTGYYVFCHLDLQEAYEESISSTFQKEKL
jgi:DNA repair exonuclease SbcCD nuclease subunit